MAIEVKAKTSINKRDLKGLRAILEEKTFKKAICIYLGDQILEFDDITVYPFYIFLKKLWENYI